MTLAPILADIESNRALIIVAIISSFATVLTVVITPLIQGHQRRTDKRDMWRHQTEIEARAITRQNEIIGQVSANTTKIHALSAKTDEVYLQGNGAFIAQLRATLDSERRTLALLHGLISLHQERGQPAPKVILDNLLMTEQRISDVLAALDARKEGNV